jgi:hypothetical protein
VVEIYFSDPLQDHVAFEVRIIQIIVSKFLKFFDLPQSVDHCLVTEIILDSFSNFVVVITIE